MIPVRLIILALAFTSVSCRPKETTHDLLSRLGFDPIQKPGINHHKKRVADTSDKARFGGSYNSDTDSHMFIVRLPPHKPYYSNLNNDKSENEVISKESLSLPVNGKPSQIYHWNIPLIKKLAKHKKAHKHDSKIVRLKIKSDEDFYNKLKSEGKPNVYKLKKDHVMSIKELAEHQNDMPAHKSFNKLHLNDVYDKDSALTRVIKHTNKYEKSRTNDDSNLTFVKYSKYDNIKINRFENNKKNVEKKPLVYSPAIPKDNSFYKYFPGNGKPKSFYVIEKSENPSRYHRLL